MAKIVVITAKRNGYRRCGISHPDHAVEYPADKFTAEQLKILKADPGLVVQEAEAPGVAESDDAKGRGGKSK
ncbi:MAG: HI1506-related protein [Sinobacteraceae bacterium]|nr:HI1506-related protein [Nevskiaceae bacterium]